MGAASRPADSGGRLAGHRPPGRAAASRARGRDQMFVRKRVNSEVRRQHTRRSITASVTVAGMLVVLGVLGTPAQADLSRTAFELDRNALAGAAAGDDWSLIDDGSTDPNND